jgi:hypothetical protein
LTRGFAGESEDHVAVVFDRVASSDRSRIALVEILADMIEFAWWPVMHYRSGLDRRTKSSIDLRRSGGANNPHQVA